MSRLEDENEKAFSSVGPCEKQKEDKESPVKGEIWMKLFQQLFTLDFCSWHFSQLKAIVCLQLVGESCGGKEGDDNTEKERQDIWESSKPAPIYLPQFSQMGYKNKDTLMCTTTSYCCQWSWLRYWDHSTANV